MSRDVRAATPEDLPQLTDIYNHYVLSGHSTFDLEPFGVEDRKEWFSHYGETGPYRLLVAVQGSHVLGYATSSRFRPRPAYRTSVEISAYCDPQATGRGVGSALYTALFHGLADEGLHRAFAGIALPNDPSVALHRRFGFRKIGVYTEAGHKFGRYWDVLWLERPL